MKNKVPWYKSITFAISLIVSLSTIGGAIFFGQIVSARILIFFNNLNSQNLQLASSLGIQICDQRFEELQMLRLSDDEKMVETMRHDALNSIELLSEQFPYVEIIVVERGAIILRSTAADDELDENIFHLPKKFPAELKSLILGNGAVIHWRYFPLWRWHIIALTTAENAFLPIRFIQYNVLFTVLGIVFVFILSLSIVFAVKVRKPLKKLSDTAESVRNGKMVKTGIISSNEIGIAAASFDVMVDGLENTMEKLKETAHHNNILLMEVHHRVRNNLNVIISLLNLSSQNLPDSDDVKRVFEDSKNRIMTIAMVHGQLYETGDFGSLNIDIFIPDLTEMIRYNFDPDDRVVLEYDLAEASLEIDTAVTLGLFVNEAITNSYKYAFPEKREGSIRISFRSTDSEHVIEIADDGVGADPSLFTGVGSSLGISLMHELSVQLAGELSFNVDNGVKISMAFPNKKKR